MASREHRRAQLVPQVARALRSQDYRVSFSQAFGHADRHVIIVALPDDKVGYVFDQLEAADGFAVLAMPRRERLELAMLYPASSARLQVAAEDDSIAEVHEQSEVSMLFDYLRQVHSAVVCRVAARLIDQRVPEPVC